MPTLAHDLLRTVDWSRTSVGPVETWPRSLRSYVDLILGLPTPAIVFWGEDQTQIYNDGYATIMGPRHPQYFGATYRECWPDTYPLLIPLMRQVLDEGKTVEVTREPITLTRHGFEEETYFTFTFSPLRDDEGRIAGIYQPVVELTDAVLRERRAETLRLLTAQRDPLAQATEPFAANPADAPLVAMYLWDDERAELRIAAATGSPLDACAARLAPLATALAEAFGTNRRAEVTLDGEGEPLRSVFLAPLRRAPSDLPLGVMAFGVSPRLRLDAAYREFFEAAAREIATSLVAQRAERAQREEKDRQAQRMAALFANAPVGIALLRGPDHVFEVANPMYAALLQKHDLLERPIREALPELAGQGIYELLDNVFASGEPYLGRSIRIVIDDPRGRPEERFFDFAYQPLPGEDGRPESILVIVFEVTDLSKARRDAEAASRAKDEFFAILGHELRNPLAPITTALQLMRMRSDHVHAKERTIIERQVEHMTRLLDDLLDVSRITRGKVTLTRVPLEVAGIVAKGIELASPLLEQQQHHLEVDVPGSGLVVDGDAVRLAQVVSNLVANAAKYTEPGGRIRVTARRSGSRMVLEVADTGIGIAAAMLPRVFEAFAQEQQSLERAQGGLGLGLAIVDSLVKLHGGTVTARSAGQGLGSTFTVELPLSAEAPIAAELARGESADPGPPLSGALRILVVDDNVDAAELLAEALGSFGYHTLVAHDGAAALRAVDGYAPDIALLDLGLPVMDGYELAGRLRSSPRGERMKLVAITGYGQESDRRRTAAAGFDAHLVKPVQLAALAQLIDEYRRALG